MIHQPSSEHISIVQTFYHFTLNRFNAMLYKPNIENKAHTQAALRGACRDVEQATIRVAFANTLAAAANLAVAAATAAAAMLTAAMADWRAAVVAVEAYEVVMRWR